MDRRAFLRAALSLAPAALIVPPAVSYFLAPRGGWPAPMTATEVLASQARMSNTMAFYVSEYARVLNELVGEQAGRLRRAEVFGHHRLDLHGSPDQFYVRLEDRTRVDYDYVELFQGPERPQTPKTLAMRSPERFKARVARAFERARQRSLLDDVVAYGGVA